ncbi:MAG: hypothetical protein JWM43_592 [Acidobacteriaceae bacterium]|nr:hypothetical protein [Acidobacteriaceae bacterium]
MFGLSLFVHAQAVPTATGGIGGMQIGVGATYVRPDYSRSGDKGPTLYGTFDFTEHIGIEGDVHYASVFTPGDVGEDTYLIGPRYVFHRGRFAPYAKGLLGRGVMSFQFDNSPHHNEGFWVYALGGGLDFKAPHHINIRVFDFEYQQWPTFNPHTLSPMVMTIGVAYRIR